MPRVFDPEKESQRLAFQQALDDCNDEFQSSFVTIHGMTLRRVFDDIFETYTAF